jgi:DNA-binding transcriptional ArsR family regulator
VLAALGSPVRRAILSLIWDQELPAGAIAAAFAVTKPTISQHLSVLRKAGLVTSRAVGTSRLYQARKESLRGLRAAIDSPGKWINASDAPERALVHTGVQPTVVAAADVDTDQAATFRAFTDPAVYSRWLGVPVTIEDGRFACTMEWANGRPRPVRAGLLTRAHRDELGLRG